MAHTTGTLNSATNLAPQANELIAKIRDLRLTYLPKQRCESLVSAVREVDHNAVSGIFIEAGCALGGSTILIASTMLPDRKLSVYDVFGMIPPPTDYDPPEVHNRYSVIRSGESRGIRGDTYYGYQDNLYDTVKKNLQEFNCLTENVVLIKGLLQETMEITAPVALAHIDVDWYDPVKCALNRIAPWLSIGGIIILDDYSDWGGCKKAADEFLVQHGNEFITETIKGSLKLTRISAAT